MSKIPDPRKREEAFKTYCRYRDIDLIAQESGVSVQTVYNWRREDKWDDKLNDLTSRFQGMMSVMKRAENDLIIADWFSETRLLEWLELQVGQSIALDGLRPKTWNEALATMKFVMDRKDKLFERARKKPSTPEEKTTALAEDATPAAVAERDAAMEEMLRLVSHTPPSSDIVDSVTGVTPASEPVLESDPLPLEEEV